MKPEVLGHRVIDNGDTWVIQFVIQVGDHIGSVPLFLSKEIGDPESKPHEPKPSDEPRKDGPTKEEIDEAIRKFNERENQDEPS